MGNLLCCSESHHTESCEISSQITEATEENRNNLSVRKEDWDQTGDVDEEKPYVEVTGAEGIEEPLNAIKDEFEKYSTHDNEDVREHIGNTAIGFDDTEEDPIATVLSVPLCIVADECSERQTDSEQNATEDICESTQSECNEPEDNSTECFKYINGNENDTIVSDLHDTTFTDMTNDAPDERATFDEYEAKSLTNTTNPMKENGIICEAEKPVDDAPKIIDSGVEIFEDTSSVVSDKGLCKENVDGGQGTCAESLNARVCMSLQLADLIYENKKLLDELRNVIIVEQDHTEDGETWQNQQRCNDGLTPSYLPRRPSPLVISGISSLEQNFQPPNNREEDIQSKQERPSEEMIRQLNKEKLQECYRDRKKPQLTIIEELKRDYLPWPTPKEKATNKKYSHGSLVLLKKKRQRAYNKMMQQHMRREGFLKAMKKHKERMALDVCEDTKRLVSQVLPCKPTAQNKDQTTSYQSAGGRRFTKEEKGHNKKRELNGKDEERRCMPYTMDSERKDGNELEENREGWPPPTSMLEKLKQKRLIEEMDRFKKLTERCKIVSEPDDVCLAPIQRQFSCLPMDQRLDSFDASGSTDHARREENSFVPIKRQLSFIPRDNNSGICTSEHTSLGSPSRYVCNTPSVESLPQIKTDRDSCISSISNQSLTTLCTVGVSRSLCEWSERGKNFVASSSKPFDHKKELPSISTNKYGKTQRDGSLAIDPPSLSNESRSRQPFSFSNHLTNAALRDTLLDATRRLKDAGTKVSADDLQRLENPGHSTNDRQTLPDITDKKDTVNIVRNTALSKHTSHMNLDKI